jgi:5S rRNA maturation endonuclease (ribonuclease M5)
MDRQEELHRIKTIPPEIILKDLNIPFVKRPSYIEAPAIWRGEKRPSVSIQQNDLGEWLWHDFGSDEGGSWIDLVMVLYDWDYVTAVGFLRERYLGNSDIQIPKVVLKSNRSSIVKILEVKEVSSPALLKYLEKRGIRKVPNWLREIHWEIRGKRYFGVGIRTAGGTYSVRNPFGKWTLRSSESDRHSYSLIEKGREVLAIFEGLFDALTWEQLGFEETDILILNSTVNVKKVDDVIVRYRILILGLDNDKAGSLARREIENSFNGRIYRLEFLSKDLNESFCKGEEVSLKR